MKMLVFAVGALALATIIAVGVHTGLVLWRRMWLAGRDRDELEDWENDE